MASISIPCLKSSTIAPQTSRNRKFSQQIVSFSRAKPSFLYGSAAVASLQGRKQGRFPILKAQVHEVSTTDKILNVILKFFLSCASVLQLKSISRLKASIEGSSNSVPMSSTKLESPSSDGEVPNVVDNVACQSTLSESTISVFMAEVSDIVMLVDSRDIMELKLKQNDSELIIRKKAAFAQAPPAAPVVMMQPSQQHLLSPQPPMSQPMPAAATPAAPAASALPSSSKGSKSLLPALRCPMAGTFYRCPAPGEPPFVKVGDKVQKGQVVCIIEAMKLMNEIEADQSGTVVEILAEDGKPVSVDMPLLIVQP